MNIYNIYIYSCCLVAKSCLILLKPRGLANPLDRGALGAIVHEIANRWTQLNTYTHTHTHTHTSLIAQLVKNPSALQETPVRFLGRDNLLEKGIGYPLQYSGLENSMDCIVHGVAKSQTQLSDFHLSLIYTHTHSFSDSFPL